MWFITYNPPPGDDRVTDFFGIEFFAGRPEPVDPALHPDLTRKAEEHPCFSVEKPVEAASEKPEDEPALTAGALLKEQEHLHWKTFQARARGVLGDGCPSAKADIIEALEMQALNDGSL